MRDPDEKWWEDDSHPDAAAHREWLKEKEATEVARKGPSTSNVNWDDLDYCLEAIGKATRQFVDNETAPLKARIKELEAKQLTLGGVWKPNCVYGENCLVSYRGGLWLSRVPSNSTRPGTGPSWRLAVKSGEGRQRNEESKDE